jgi:hypothetical protein
MAQIAEPTEQDVLDCLDHFLSSHRRHARIDTDGAILARDIVFQFERRAKLQVARQLQYVPHTKRRPTRVFFCENESYGAFAVRDRYDFIILHIGIVPAITDFCLRMMEHPGLWTHIGATNNAGDDRARLAFSVVFANECFDFIVRHELAHLVLGHCEFVSSDHRTGTMEDTDGRFPSGADPITIQALEVAADGHAAIWGVQRLPQIRQMFGRRPGAVDDAYRVFQRTNYEAMRNYLLAVFFVFRLFHETTWSGDTLTRRPHPPAPIRFHVACLHLQEYFQQLGETKTQRHLTNAMQEIWELGEFIFAKTLDRTPDLSAKRHVMETESEQHFTLVHDRAQTLPKSLFGLSEIDDAITA